MAEMESFKRAEGFQPVPRDLNPYVIVSRSLLRDAGLGPNDLLAAFWSRTDAENAEKYRRRKRTVAAMTEMVERKGGR